jgi:hypothetical protein
MHVNSYAVLSLVTQAIAAANHVLEEDIVRVKRDPSVFSQRLSFHTFSMKHGHTKIFSRHMRMSLGSFNKLLSIVQEDIDVEEDQAGRRGGKIIPEIQLYSSVRWLAGGSYTDILYFCGISKPSFYRVVWKAIFAINRSKSEHLAIKFPQTQEECATAAEGFQSISSGDAIDNCVSVHDGFHLETVAPSRNEAKNVRSYFSGHYQTYGINCQAACDHHSRFTFFGVAGPGVMADRDAIDQVQLGKLIENLPGLYCAIGDAAYQPSMQTLHQCLYALHIGRRNSTWQFCSVFWRLWSHSLLYPNTCMGHCNVLQTQSCSPA